MPPSGANPFERASSFVGPGMPPPVPPVAPVAPVGSMGPAMPPPVAQGFNGPPPGFGTGPRHRQSTEAASAVAGPWAIQPQPGVAPAWPAPAQESPTDVRQALGTGRPRLMVTQLDGTEQGEYPLKEGDNLIGREVGGIFAEDNLLSSKHATIIVQGQQAWVRDEGSRNGVYARIAPRQHIELQDNDQFCIGRIILRFEFRPTAEGVGFLHLVVGRDVDKGLFPYVVPQTGMTLGRSRADLKFPKDGWVSGIHCQLMPVAGQVMLVDLKSSNGTFLRIRGLRPLAHGDALLMGQRIFHMQLG
jgi:pSer/pThr/pTyr-binding forkhead associated (FHA) protein